MTGVMDCSILLSEVFSAGFEHAATESRMQAESKWRMGWFRSEGRDAAGLSGANWGLIDPIDFPMAAPRMG